MLADTAVRPSKLGDTYVSDGRADYHKARSGWDARADLAFASLRFKHIAPVVGGFC